MLELSTKHVEDAIIFATEKHAGQTRKGDGRPYILHPLSVMNRLYQVKKSKNIFMLMVAAMLHDTVEDCAETQEDKKNLMLEVSEKFGHHVAGLVEELTLDKEKYASIGKKEYLSQELLKMSNYALCLKLADRWDNICDTEKMDDIFKNKYISETEFMIDRLKKKRKLTKSQKELVKNIQKEIKKLKKRGNQHPTPNHN